ncbi:MAG: DUF5329 domain-containing protein [Pseudomonadota bacterium]
MPFQQSTLCQKTGSGRFFIACTMWAVVALIALLGNGLAIGSNDVAEQEIAALIAAVESSDCFFLRNGARHDSKEAADHLRLKYQRGRRYANTAEQFIERLASKSSWSGKPYFIECDGERFPSGDWLNARLKLIRQ